MQDSLKTFLEQSLQDDRLSRGERSTLSTALQQADLDAADRSEVRALAFALAREAIAQRPPVAVLTWLEEVIRAMTPTAASDDVSEVHFSPGSDCPQRIAQLFRSARQTVDACVFTITDDRVTGAILEAHARGIRIRIVTDNEKAFDAGSDIKTLQKAGVAVRVDCTPFHMHHKFALFDGRLLLNGSYNWTRGAAENNLENFTITSDRRQIRPFAEVFEKLWCDFA